MQAPTPSEAHFVIEDGGGRLYGVGYRPARPRAARRCCVLLNPLDNEANNSTRFYVRTARALAAAGIVALRFDYRGTGNSSGSFSEVTTATLLADVRLLAEFAAREYGTCELLLAGARFGGFLALLYGCADPLGAELILWDPVLDIRREFRTNFVNKTSLLRKMMRGAPEESRPRRGGAGGAEEVVELSCVPFGRAFVAEMERLTIDPAAASGLRGLALLTEGPQGAGASQIISALERAAGCCVRRLPVRRGFVGWGAEDFSERSELAQALAGATFEHLAAVTAGAGG